MIQLSVTVRNARLDQTEATIGTSPKLQLRSGSAPANCAASATGTLLAELTLPSDWLADAANGQKLIAGGPWAGTAVASGIVGHFRLLNSAGSACHMQGTATAPGGGGDLIVDNTNIAVDQNVAVNSFTLNAGNA